MADDTIIVFVSDHGDMLGERGIVVQDELLRRLSRVPLMIAAPDLAPGPAGCPPVSTSTSRRRSAILPACR
jgi:choline-sulfatase